MFFVWLTDALFVESGYDRRPYLGKAGFLNGAFEHPNLDEHHYRFSQDHLYVSLDSDLVSEPVKSSLFLICLPFNIAGYSADGDIAPKKFPFSHYTVRKDIKRPIHAQFVPHSLVLNFI